MPIEGVDMDTTYDSDTKTFRGRSIEELLPKIRAELGYEPQVPFAQGLADVVQWYRDNRQWWEPLKERAAL